MADIPDDKTTLKLIRQSKDKEINFAFGQGKDVETHCLFVDKKKAPKSMGEQLKKDSKDIKKVTYGTLKLEGKELTFSCQKELAGLEKTMKEYLRKKGIKFKPKIGGGKK